MGLFPLKCHFLIGPRRFTCISAAEFSERSLLSPSSFSWCADRGYRSTASSGGEHGCLMVCFQCLRVCYSACQLSTVVAVARYWSMVPYQLGTGTGRQAVRYSARACSRVTDPMPQHPGHDFLRDALRTTLQRGEACMELLVQPRTSSGMDVEDSRIEWKETQAPFYPVATIRIPRQVFDTPEQNAFCENLSFTPWHALPEHKPLGVTNRLRKVIYDHISRVRHEMNSTNRQEPR